MVNGVLPSAFILYIQAHGKELKASVIILYKYTVGFTRV